jgi:protein PhnA
MALFMRARLAVHRTRCAARPRTERRDGDAEQTHGKTVLTTLESARMNSPACPVCTLDDVAAHPDRYECQTCGHAWTKGPESAAVSDARVVKDANGTLLADGDSVVLIKSLKLRGSSEVLKQGTKVKNIRLVDGDHEIDCKIDGSAMALKACFVKKA